MNPLYNLAILSGQGDIQFIIMTKDIWDAFKPSENMAALNDYFLEAMTIETQKEFPNDVESYTPTAYFNSMNPHEFFQFIEINEISFDEIFQGYIY